MARVVGDGELVEETDEEMNAFINQPGRIHYTAIATRPGVSDCFQLLEQRHYAPGTPRNDEYHLRFVMWGGLAWMVLSIPLEEKSLMETAAAANGLKIVDGIPTIIGGNGIMQFPISGSDVFTLENTPGHPVYKRP